MTSWDVVVTALVGVAGIGGTILTAWLTTKSQAENLRYSIQTENERARLAETRSIYAEFFASMDRIIITINRLRNLFMLPDSPRRGELKTKVEDELSELYVKLSELLLRGPTGAGSVAHELAFMLREYSEKALNDEIPDNLPDEWAHKRRQLLYVMRSDLGESTKDII